MMHIKIANLLRTATQTNTDRESAMPEPADPVVSQSTTHAGGTQLPGAPKMIDKAGGMEYEMVWRMIAHTAPPHRHERNLGSDGLYRQRKVIHVDPDGETGELEDAIRAFHEIDGRQGAELGLVIAVNHAHFIALHLHKERNKRPCFRYYDPDPSVDSRDKLKAKICQRLRRCGMDSERPFTGVRQGESESDRGHSGIHAVLAMREMLNGGSELKAVAQDIQSWQEKLLRNRKSGASQAMKGDAFLARIQDRSKNGSTLAKRFAERCSAFQYVVDCFPSREAARYQALNKRMYREVMPRVMCGVSFQDYPALQSANLWDVLCGMDDSVNPFKLPDLPRETLLGYLLLCGGALNHRMNRVQMQEYLEWLTQGMILVPRKTPAPGDRHFAQLCLFRPNKKPTPGDRYFTQLCHGLGTMLRDHYASRYSKATSRGKSGNDRSVASRGESLERMSLIDMFQEIQEMPEALTNNMAMALDEAVNRDIISQNRKRLILKQLKPDAAHLCAGDMSIDLAVLPGKEKGESYVHVMATPNRTDQSLKPHTLWKFNDVFLDEGRKIRLSDKLKKNIQAHFHKIGWANRLGVTLGQAFPLPEARDDGDMATLPSIARKFSHFHHVSRNSALSSIERQEAKLAAEIADKEIRRFFRGRLAGIDQWSFRLDLVRIIILPDSEEITFCRIASALIDAVMPVAATQTIPPPALRKYRHMLKTCHDKLSLWAMPGRIHNRQDAKAVNHAMNALDNGIDTIDAYLDAQGSGRQAVAGFQSASRT